MKPRRRGRPADLRPAPTTRRWPGPHRRQHFNFASIVQQCVQDFLLSRRGEGLTVRQLGHRQLHQRQRRRRSRGSCRRPDERCVPPCATLGTPTLMDLLADYHPPLPGFDAALQPDGYTGRAPAAAAWDNRRHLGPTTALPTINSTVTGAIAPVPWEPRQDPQPGQHLHGPAAGEAASVSTRRSASPTGPPPVPWDRTGWVSQIHAVSTRRRQPVLHPESLHPNYRGQLGRPLLRAPGHSNGGDAEGGSACALAPSTPRRAPLTLRIGRQGLATRDLGFPRPTSGGPTVDLGFSPLVRSESHKSRVETPQLTGGATHHGGKQIVEVSRRATPVEPPGAPWQLVLLAGPHGHPARCGPSSPELVVGPLTGTAARTSSCRSRPGRSRRGSAAAFPGCRAPWPRTFSVALSSGGDRLRSIPPPAPTPTGGSAKERPSYQGRAWAPAVAW